MNKIRPRFSLLTLLLLGTIAGLSFAVWKLGSQVKPLKEEVERLRAEVGELHIEDPTKLNIIRVDTKDMLEWKWRVWIPEGRKFKVRSAHGAIPRRGYPEGGGTLYAHESGEQILRYRIVKDPRDGEWYGSLIHTDGSVGKDHQPWVKWKSASSESRGVDKRTRVGEVDQPVDLFRLQVKNRDTSTGKPVEPVGFMIWMEPMP